MDKKSIKGTQTEHNVLASFAGESQARSRYDMFAIKAEAEGYQQIAAIFREIANQEFSHAMHFYTLLEGGMVQIAAGYPAGVIGDTAANLAAAAAGEREEWSDLYSTFAQTAREEGFPHIAALYDNIAKVEISHEKRFLALLERMNEGKTFHEDKPIEWQCRRCGYPATSGDAPKRCPVCGEDQSFFQRFPQD
jgi:rubrerythrin